MPSHCLQLNGRIGWAREVLWRPALLSVIFLLLVQVMDHSDDPGTYPFFPNSVLTALPMMSNGLLEYYQLLIYIGVLWLLLGAIIELTPRAVIVPAYKVILPGQVKNRYFVFVPKMYRLLSFLNFSLSGLEGLCYTVFLTEVVKLWIAEPRPDFRERCFGPVGEADQAAIDALPQLESAIPYCLDAAEGDEEKLTLLDGGRKSFPSGHTSTAMYCGGFVSLLLLWTLYYRAHAYCPMCGVRSVLSLLRCKRTGDDTVLMNKTDIFASPSSSSSSGAAWCDCKSSSSSSSSSASTTRMLTDSISIQEEEELPGGGGLAAGWGVEDELELGVDDGVGGVKGVLLSCALPLCLVPAVLGAMVGYSRIASHHHHPWDVNAGLFLGAMIACFSFARTVALLRRREDVRAVEAVRRILAGAHQQTFTQTNPYVVSQVAGV